MLPASYSVVVGEIPLSISFYIAHTKYPNKMLFNNKHQPFLCVPFPFSQFRNLYEKGREQAQKRDLWAINPPSNE